MKRQVTASLVAVDFAFLPFDFIKGQISPSLLLFPQNLCKSKSFAGDLMGWEDMKLPDFKKWTVNFYVLPIGIFTTELDLSKVEFFCLRKNLKHTNFFDTISSTINKNLMSGSVTMITTSLNVLNLCVPCYNHCKYCLLSWNGKCLGIEYERSVAYARKFCNWLKTTHKEINFTYFFGYSMDHPDLPNAIKFMQETNSPGGEFLQFNGMRMRTREELRSLFTHIGELGVRLVDFTFYGTQEYHDEFAGRKGDFELMMNSMEIALEKGLNVEVGIPITKENLSQIDTLLSLLPQDKIKIFIFTPHSGGRGISLLGGKITVHDYEKLSPNAKKYFNRSKNQTPIEWLRGRVSVPENRILSLSLLPSNIDYLEHQSFEDTLRDLEKLDEAYYDKLPDFQSLLERYAVPEDMRLYSKKDLYLLYRKRYIDDERINVLDITDERFSGSLRY